MCKHQNIHQQTDEELTDKLIAISVISKRLATKLQEGDTHESDETTQAID